MDSNNPRQCLNAEEYAKVQKSLKKIMAKTGWSRPVREYMEGDDIEWRYGKCPDYTLADLRYLEGKSMNHPEGSLEQIVENRVKTWEFEVTHKTNVKQIMTNNPETFTVGHNNACPYSAQGMMEKGSYNIMLDNIKEENKKFYNPNCTFAESHQEFFSAFETFSWEVIEVYSGPPNVSFSWRHWGKFNGKFDGKQGQGQTRIYEKKVNK